MYISFWTTSEPWPDVRRKRSVSSKTGADRPVAIETGQPFHLPRHAPPERLFGRKDVLRSAGPLDLHARSSARNGLLASSVPSAVSGPWPEWTTVSGGRVRQRSDRSEQRVPVAEREIGAADRPGEEDVAGEEVPVRVVGEVAGRVTGHVVDLKCNPGRIDCLASGQQRRLAGVGTGRDADEIRVRAAKDVQLALGEPHRSSGRVGQFGEGAEVVVVAVREQDRGARRAACSSAPSISDASSPGSITTASVASSSARTR